MGFIDQLKERWFIKNILPKVLAFRILSIWDVVTQWLPIFLLFIFRILCKNAIFRNLTCCKLIFFLQMSIMFDFSGWHPHTEVDHISYQIEMITMVTVVLLLQAVLKMAALTTTDIIINFDLFQENFQVIIELIFVWNPQ